MPRIQGAGPYSHKDELFQAGLGEKEISFPSLEMDAIYVFQGADSQHFPKAEGRRWISIIVEMPPEQS